MIFHNNVSGVSPRRVKIPDYKAQSVILFLIMVVNICSKFYFELSTTVGNF